MVGLTFRAEVAARDFLAAFEVRRGETVAVLGPNGAGKSTVLQIVAGLIRPDTGAVALGDRTLTDTESGAMVPPHQRRTCLMAQDPLLFPHLSALDNVAFGPRCHGLSRTEARDRAWDWLDRVGVAALAGRRPHELSGGQAQRVALARAMAGSPDVLLLDEPMAALDVEVRTELRQTLREVLSDRTVLLVTHDVVDAALLADRILVIEGGRVVEEGDTSRVLSAPTSAFAGRLAGLNLVTGHWRDDAVRTGDGLVIRGETDGVSIPDGSPVVATFRPSAVAVFTDVPGGSPRNVVDTSVTALEPLGDRIRVRTPGLSADITPSAVAELRLEVGTPVTLTVKATAVSIYPR
ncbi:MAG: sulfate/molybdate ABC transporter ATP-binding protein [Nocardioides sp.]